MPTEPPKVSDLPLRYLHFCEREHRHGAVVGVIPYLAIREVESRIEQFWAVWIICVTEICEDVVLYQVKSGLSRICYARSDYVKLEK